MQTLSNVEIQERLKTVENKSQFLKEILGTDFSAVMDEMIASRVGSNEETEARILSLKGKGMTTGGIKAHLKEFDGLQISQGQIANAMENARIPMQDWSTRPLAKMYPIVFLDGMRFAVKDSGKTINKCSYHMIGINTDGVKELLGIWISDSEGAKFWGQVLNDIKNRGVEDILIACVDGLKGFPQAISATYPNTAVQLCINHMTRNSTRFLKGAHKEKMYADLKTIYTAPTEEAGLVALHEVQKNWPDFQPFLQRWEKEWAQIATFFSYSPAVRRLIYTTNHVESLHSEFRRVTNATTIFANDEHLRLTIWLAQRDITCRWVQPINDWGEIIAQLAIAYPERIDLF